MAFSRQLGVIGILGACFIVAVACDDDGDKIANAGDAGEGGDDGGGKAGTGGKSSGGSNNNSAGDGGTATGGTTSDAGAAGETVGGAAPLGGAAGDGGTAGDGGSVAGGGAGAGAGGEAGGAGEGGSGPAAAKSCGNECEVTEDCVVVGALFPKVCDPQSKRCIEQFSACEAHDDCVPWASGFVKTCATQTDCDDVFGVCVTWEGNGYCALEPSGGFCFFAQPGALPVELLEFGDPDPSPVEVCVNMHGRCDAGACMLSCAATPTCDGVNNGNTCNETTGLCECSVGTQCKSGVCGADAHCVECVTEAHCSGNLNGNTSCVAGECGCTSATTCLDETASATPVCE